MFPHGTELVSSVKILFMNQKQEPKDRHLDVPAEANRDKHINFVAEEQGEKDPADEEKSKNLEERIPDSESERKQKD
jgi:hypothetical protein